MKGKILGFLFSLIAFTATSQTINGRLYTQFNNYYKWRGGAFDSVLLLPNVTATAGLRPGAIRYNPADSSVYRWTGSQWLVIAGSGGSGSSYTFTNGLTESAGVVKLGGTADEPISVENSEPITFTSITGSTLGSLTTDIGLSKMSASTTGKQSRIDVTLDSIRFTPNLGKLFIDTLAATADTSLKFIVYNPNTRQVHRYTGPFRFPSTDNLDDVNQRGNTTNTRIIANGGVQTVDSVVVKSENDSTLVHISYSPTFGPFNQGVVKTKNSGNQTSVSLNGGFLEFVNQSGFSTSISNSSATQTNSIQWADSSGTTALGGILNGDTVMANSKGLIDFGTVSGGGSTDTIPLATFTVGSAAAGDTAAFTTSTLAGSFYLDGTDTFFVTSYRVALQGTSPSITPEVWFNDSLNVTAGGTRLATGSAITNTTTGTAVTATTNKIPQGNWVFVRFSAVATRPTYFTLTLFGYRIRKS